MTCDLVICMRTPTNKEECIGMKRRNRGRKALSVILILVLALGIGAWAYARRADQDTETAFRREREYTAAIDDITVGINVSGKITGEQVQLHGMDGLILAAYRVDVGERIAKGDVIGEYTPESISDALQRTLKAYQEAEEALNQASSLRRTKLTNLSSRLNNDKRLHANTYNACKEALNQLKTRLRGENSAITEKLRSAPNDEKLLDQQARVSETLQAVERALSALEENRADEQKDEADAAGQAEADLAAIERLDQQVLLAQQACERCLQQLEALEQLMQDPAIRAETGGVVLQCNTAPGDELTAAQPLLTLSTEQNWRFTFSAEQDEITGIEVGQRVEFVTNAYPTEPLNGIVERISRVANEEGKYSVTVKIDSAAMELLEGMNGYGTVILAQKKDVLTLSNKAISQRDGGQFVLVRNDLGELVERQIVTGFSDGRVSEILEGLTAGDIVVVVDVL